MAEPKTRQFWQYPEEDDAAGTFLHFAIRSLLLEVVREWLAEQGIRAFAGSDQFVYWRIGNPHKALAPDLYVLYDVDPDAEVRTWKTWTDGPPPRFALEIVSGDLQKDYVLAPMRYAELGVQELVIFDPEPGDGRVRWQIYRRTATDFQLAESTDADRVESVVLGAHLVCVAHHTTGTPRIRLATGDGLVPTAAERAEAENARLRALLAELQKR